MLYATLGLAAENAVTLTAPCGQLNRGHRENVMKYNRPIAERLAENIKIDENDCHIWTGKTKVCKGYGRISIRKRAFLTHRLAWELKNGPIPENMCVLHKCDIPACNNPDHLFLGTLQDNTADMFAKKRGNRAKGEDHPRTKLTPTIVLAIRAAASGVWGEVRSLAKQYEVSEGCIGGILKRRTWKHL